METYILHEVQIDGTTFENATRLASINDNYDIKDINIVASDAILYILWNAGNYGELKTIYFMKSIDDGTTFENATIIRKVANYTYVSSLTVDAFKNNVYASWIEDNDQMSFDNRSTIYFTRSTDHGTTFENATIIKRGIADSAPVDPKIAASDNGVYLVEGKESESFTTDPNYASTGPLSGNQEVFLNTISHSKTLNSEVLSQSGTSPSGYNGSFPVIIDGKLENGEWTGPQVHKFTSYRNESYETLFASKSDDTNLYIVAGVDGPKNFTGGAVLSLLFDHQNNRKVDRGDSGIMMYRGFCCENEDNYTLQDMFYTFENNSNVLRDDESDGGTKNGNGSILFSNNIEYFELSFPLCSGDRAHDFCITTDDIIGLYSSLKLNGDLSLDPHPFGFFKGFGLGFSPGEGVIPHPDYSLSTDLVPPGAFILELLGRFTDAERSNLLKALTPDEQYNLQNEPTEGDVADFLIKLEPAKLTDFLYKQTPEEIKNVKDKINSYFADEKKFDEILNKLTPEQRSNVTNKIPSEANNSTSREHQEIPEPLEEIFGELG